MKYKMINHKDAMDQGFTGEDLKDRYGDYVYRHGIFEMDGDKMVRLIGSDGGEPEDQTLFRDWSWVVEALNEAYETGYKKGEQDQRTRDHWASLGPL